MIGNSFRAIGRRLPVVFGLALAVQLVATPQSAHAEVSWMNDIWQPLMEQVVTPTLEKGIDSWQARHAKDKTASQSPVSQTATATATSPASPSSAIQWDAEFSN